MINKFLKIAGVKTIEEFYKKYPSEEAFYKKHPQARNLKELKNGGMKGKPGVYSDGYSGTYSAGVYYDLGGAVFPMMRDSSDPLPKYDEGSESFRMGGFLRKFQGDLNGSQYNGLGLNNPQMGSITGAISSTNPFTWTNVQPLGQSSYDINYATTPIQPPASINQNTSVVNQQDKSNQQNKNNTGLNKFFNKAGNVANTAQGLINIADFAVTALDNRKQMKDAEMNKSIESLPDNRVPTMPIGVSGQRGDYDQFGIFRPDEYVVNKGMYTSNTPGLQLKQFGGGMIAEALSLPSDEIPITMAPPISSEPSTRSSSSSGGGSKSSGANPIAEQTWNDISSDFKGVKHLGIWGDKRHQKTKSDHNTGDALDIGIVDLDQGSKIAQKLLQEANDRNIKYVIFNKQIWNPSISNEWRPYKGDNPHTSHVHVSFNRNSQDLGQISLTHNNPLNIHQGKFAEGYGGKQGSKDGGGYVSIFPDLTTGIQAAKDLLFGPNYNNLTISQARNKWVSGNPSSSNNSTNYIVKEMGGDKRLSDLNTAEREKLIKQFSKWEGKQAYNKIKDMPLFSYGGGVPSYKDGGVYELTEDEIRDIISKGGNIEFLD